MSYAMDSESMYSGDESSSSELGASFVCDICQGFGDMKNPRGFILKLKPEEKIWDDACYVYAYMHHANVRALLASEEKGCDVCAIICSSFREYSHGEFHKQVAQYSQAREFKRLRSMANTTQTDDEALTATRFAGVVKKERAFTEERLRKYDNGRIVLVVYCDQESGPRGSSKASHSVYAWVLGIPLLEACRTLFTVFKSACVFLSQQEILA